MGNQQEAKTKEAQLSSFPFSSMEQHTRTWEDADARVASLLREGPDKKTLALLGTLRLGRTGGKG